LKDGEKVGQEVGVSQLRPKRGSGIWREAQKYFRKGFSGKRRNLKKERRIARMLTHLGRSSS